MRRNENEVGTEIYAGAKSRNQMTWQLGKRKMIHHEFCSQRLDESFRWSHRWHVTAKPAPPLTPQRGALQHCTFMRTHSALLLWKCLFSASCTWATGFLKPRRWNARFCTRRLSLWKEETGRNTLHQHKYFMKHIRPTSEWVFQLKYSLSVCPIEKAYRYVCSQLLVHNQARWR